MRIQIMNNDLPTIVCVSPIYENTESESLWGHDCSPDDYCRPD